MPDVITNNIDLWTSALLTKSTAGRGNGGKVEAYGIKKLRELILELAVRGKLVPQDPNDEPASELLKRTVAEKKRQIKANVVRETKAPIFPDEPPDHELPDSWVWSNLYEIGEINPRNEADDTDDASFVPMQSISEVFGVPVQHEVKPWGEIKSGFTHFREEDVVLAKITPCFQNGKSAVMRGLTNGFGAGTTELHVYRSVNLSTIPEYVLIYLKSSRFIGDGIPKMTGTAGQKRITRDYFAGNHFPLPPLAEQHRIVAKVNELMALCDQLEQQQTTGIEAHQTLVGALLGTLTSAASPEDFAEAWTRIADHFDTLFTTEQSIDQLKQTILQLAVMGKLVPQDPSDEPASVLLEGIAKEKRRLITAGRSRKEKALPTVDDSAIFQLPKAWEWVALGTVATFVNGDRSSRYPNSSDLQDSGIPFFGAPDMVDGVLRYDNGLRFISEDKFNELSNGKLNHKDFVMLLRGTVGKMAIFLETDEFKTGFINAQMLIIRLVNKELCDFFRLYSSSMFFATQVEAKTTGSAVRQMPASVVAEFVAPLPPLAEQYRIVAKVDELMTLCAALKARLVDAQTTKIHLADAIVEQAVA